MYLLGLRANRRNQMPVRTFVDEERNATFRFAVQGDYGARLKASSAYHKLTDPASPIVHDPMTQSVIVALHGLLAQRFRTASDAFVA